MQPHDHPGTLGYKQELKRSLRLIDLLAYGLVFIVPLAPVPLFGIVFNASHGMVPLVYGIGLIAMFFTALSYMAMVREYPVAGSVYTYASQSLGTTVGFLGGWAMMLDYLLIPTTSYVACAIAVHAALPSISPPLCVLTMVCVATLINAFGIQSTARASLVLLAVQLAIVGAFFVLGVLAVSRHVGGSHVSLLPLYNSAEFAPNILFGALSIAVLSFLGFDAITTLSEEAKDGAVAIARATILTLFACATLFVLQTWLAALFFPNTTALPPGEATDAAFYHVANLIGGSAFRFALAVPGVFLSGLAAAVTAQAASARLLYGMARDARLPAFFARVDPRRGVPLRATLLVAGLTLVLGLLLVGQLEFLSSIISFGALLGFVLLHLSVMRHFMIRRRSHHWGRHFVVPLLGIVIITDVLLNIQRSAKVVGALWLCLGLVVLASRRRQHPVARESETGSPRAATSSRCD